MTSGCVLPIIKYKTLGTFAAISGTASSAVSIPFPELIKPKVEIMILPLKGIASFKFIGTGLIR